MSDRPNILYVFTDQQSALAMSCAGNADLRTPAMDRLAAEGVRFERCYTSQPLCGPNRASMFSGLWPLEAGAPKNGMPMNERVGGRELGHLISGAGYDCVYAGKWHVPEISIPDGKHGFRRMAGFGDRGLADACVDFLRGPHERPFFLVASFDNPHNICEWGRGERLPWGELPEPPPVEELPDLPANFAVPPCEPEIIRAEKLRSWVIYPSIDYTDDDWRRHRWAYYRLTERVDAEICRLLEALDAAGLTENTVVIFSSDHGDGHGAHLWNQKCVLYEEVIRVPLVIRWPGRAAAGAVDQRHLVSNGIDLLPTCCGLAGVEPPEDVRGRSVVPLLAARGDVPWRDELAVETVFDGPDSYGTEGRALLTDRYKYAVYRFSRRREQLFDLQTDPGEMVNLAVESRHARTLDDHRRRLAAWVAETDPRGYTRFQVPGYETELRGR